MAPGCKPGGLTPYAGSNPAPCIRRISNFGIRIIGLGQGGDFNSQSDNWQSELRWAGVAQLVEHQPSKLRVASSNLVARSSSLYFVRTRARVAQG